MKALLFPGQGCQKEGMGKELYALYPQKANVLMDILGLTLPQLCLEDDNKILNRSEYLQPVLFAVCALAYDRYVSENGAPQICAGHSLGEFAALYAGGALGFEQGIELLRKRGEIMSRAPEGGMAAISGPNAEELESMLVTGGLTPSVMANFNTPTQTVISGSIQEMKKAEELFADMKGVAFLPLSVNGPYHSVHMSECSASFERVLESTCFLPLDKTVVSAVTALPYTDVNETLKKHMISPVRWSDCVNSILDMGAEPIPVYPVGPIKGMLRSIIKERGTVSGNDNTRNRVLPSAD